MEIVNQKRLTEQLGNDLFIDKYLLNNLMPGSRVSRSLITSGFQSPHSVKPFLSHSPCNSYRLPLGGSMHTRILGGAVLSCSSQVRFQFKTPITAL